MTESPAAASDDRDPPALRVTRWGAMHAVTEHFCILGAFRTEGEAEAELARIVQQREEEKKARALEPALTPYDPQFERQMGLAREIMKANRNMLRELANR